MGAADYVVKPFAPTELVARIRAALHKRSVYRQAQAVEPFRMGDLTINYLERSVTLAGRPIKLTPTQFKLLVELSSNAGRVLTHDELLVKVWGQGHSADQQLLRSFVKGSARQAWRRRQEPRLYLHGVGGRVPAGEAVAALEDGRFGARTVSQSVICTAGPRGHFPRPL